MAEQHSSEALGLSSLERFLIMAMVELIAAEETLNSLNVYPVPDGDTGSNLRATWAAFFADVDASRRAGASTVLPRIAQADARAAANDEQAVRAGLRRVTAGARGNAGVIMSEYLRGCCTMLQYDDGHLVPIDGDRLARMLHAGAQAARVAVDQPVEGTVLSVADAAAAGAARERSQAGRRGDIISPAVVLSAAVRDATEALKRSPQQLPLLAGAGVVDAGGAGLLFVLEALARVAGGRHGLPRAKDSAWLDVAPNRAFAVDQVCQVASGGPAFELMAVAEGMDAGVAAELRSVLSDVGDSVVVAGGDGVHRIHVHTDDVLGAASLVRSWARLTSPSVTRFAGPIAGLSDVAVDLQDDVLRAYARSLGFSTLGADRGHDNRAKYCIADDDADDDQARSDKAAARDDYVTLARPTAVHAVAALEACAFLAACDADPDFPAAAEEAAMLEVSNAASWNDADELLRAHAATAEQAVVFIDPVAPLAQARAFSEQVQQRCRTAVVLRLTSGALVQLGVE